jgi:hypothetical protein
VNYCLICLAALLALPLPVKAAPSSALELLPLGDAAAPPAVPAPTLNVPLFAEDGSQPMKVWYTDFNGGQPSPALKRALAAEGVAPRDIKFSYEWIQDVALFDAAGGLVLQADMPGDILEQLGLTRGVLNTEDGFPSLTALSEEDAANLGLSSRRMEWTFLEGGALITGRLADGQPYAIITGSPVEGARQFYERKTGKAISEARARELVAADLRVAPENLFVVVSGGHLDLVISPLPGGVILLSDPARTAGVIEKILAAKPPSAEVKRLQSILEFYSSGWQPLYSLHAPPSIAGKPMGSRQYPYDSYDLKLLDDMEKALAGRLKVIRVAGAVNEVEADAHSADDFHVADRINFFNGFTGTTLSGKVFQVTNGTRGLSSLESYWSALLAAHGVTRVHFPGSYSRGAGQDCSGAPN